MRWCVWVGLCVVVGAANASSEPQRIYRCGNAYTNQPDPGANCKPLAGGSVTVIEGTKVQGPQLNGSAATQGGGQAQNAAKVDVDQQRQRDAQAHAVLQAELERAEKQYADLLREWNNGEPERRADEFKQLQKYQDRVGQLRQALQRAQADIAGLQRELVRTSGGVKP